MLLSSSHLYLSGNRASAAASAAIEVTCALQLSVTGWTSSSSTWEGKSWQSPYAVARFDLEGFVQESKLNSSRSRNNSSKTVEGRAGPLSNSGVKAERTPLSLSSANRRRYLLERVVRNMSVDARLRQRFRRDGQSNEGMVDVDTNHGLVQQQPYWTPRWEWLPGFPGGNGPILRMTEGTGLFSGSLFIAGAFNNRPPVIVWKAPPGMNNSATAGEMSITEGVSLVGLITAVVQANLLISVIPAPIPIEPVVSAIDYTLLIVLACIAVAVLIVSASFTVRYLSRMGYIPLPDSHDPFY